MTGIAGGSLVLQMWASSSCILLFCWGEEVVKMSQGGSGEESIGSKTKRALLMRVNNLATKRKNWTGWHIIKAGEVGETQSWGLRP
jgi:hypothetical protein